MYYKNAIIFQNRLSLDGISEYSLLQLLFDWVGTRIFVLILMHSPRGYPIDIDQAALLILVGIDGFPSWVTTQSSEMLLWFFVTLVD